MKDKSRNYHWCFTVNDTKYHIITDTINIFTAEEQIKAKFKLFNNEILKLCFIKDAKGNDIYIEKGEL